ncbi:MAG: hypothetical protein IMY70_06950, partial [Bacteroidetes bacterium]|nr:hypothetical protein [Bacteroidota bacterium]
MKVFTKLGITLLVVFITTGMLWAQSSLDIGPKKQSNPIASEAQFDLQLKGPSGLYPPANVDATVTDDDVTVTWEEPIPGEWIQWDDGSNNGTGIGLTSGGTFWTASHWFPADLTPYDGQTLTKVSFYANGDPDATYEIMIWTGPDAGTLVSSEPVTSFTVDDFNEVTLSTPVTIDASQELWFGYEVTHAAGTLPAGRDEGPAIPEKGDMISLDGTTWDAMSIAYGLNYNWNLAAYVVATDATTPAQPLVKQSPATISTGSFVTNSGTGITKKFTPSGSKDLLGYNVYRNADPIAYTTDLTYFDENLEDGTYEYCVSAVYDEGESVQVCANPVTIGGGPTVVFFDDFESGISNWEVTGAWGITDEYAYSPSNSLTDSPGGNYLPNLDTYATMANGVDLSDPALLSADVSWWMIMDIENGNFDYLYVEVSDDDFATFTEIASFFGEDMLDPWVEYTFPLGSLLGSDNVKVRFHFYSDGGYEVDGCYIDDFSIVTSDVDEAPPEIFFDAPFAYEGTLEEYVVDAEILDASGVASAEVLYTVDGVTQPNVVGVNTGGDYWQFTIPTQDPGYQVDFQIEAVDASPNSNTALTDTASYIAGNYIGYDNAVVDFYTEITAPGGTAVVFTLVDPAQIVTALIRNYMDQSVGDNDSMMVHVWSDGGGGPGVDLIDPITIKPEANLVHTRAFTRVDLRPYAAQLSNIVGDVFVGFTVPTGLVRTTITQPGIAGRSLNFDGTTWSSYGSDYHYRIITGEAGVNPYPPPENVTAAVENLNDVHVDWDAPSGGSGELIELVQHDGTYTNAYYQAYDNGYGVVYDISAYPDCT